MSLECLTEGCDENVTSTDSPFEIGGALRNGCRRHLLTEALAPTGRGTRAAFRPSSSLSASLIRSFATWPVHGKLLYPVLYSRTKKKCRKKKRLRSAVPHGLLVYRLFAENNISHWVTFKTQQVIHTGRSQNSSRQNDPS